MHHLDSMSLTYFMYNRSQSIIMRNSHYNDVIMHTMASQITSLMIVYSSVCLHADQRKHQSSTSLAFVWGIHWWPVNSPHKWPVMRKMFPFDGIIMHMTKFPWQRSIIQGLGVSLLLVLTGCWTVNPLTYWGQDKMAATFQMKFSNSSSWMKIYKCRLRFHWSLFPLVQ